MNTKEYSPFTPGSPVPIELFVGRSGLIDNIVRYVKQASHGKLENLFLTGERGIGKTSLASFVRYLVTDQENFVGIHVFLGRVNTLEEMVRHIFDQLLKEAKSQPWYDNIVKFFGTYIKEVGLFNISVSFAPPKEELTELVLNFPEAIYNVVDKIKANKNGLFIALDDINGLVEKREFADWYKSFVDEVATRYDDFPVFIMLIGLPEKKDNLASLQPSLMRIFRVVEIEKLSDDEVSGFFTNAFKEVVTKVEPDAMNILVKYSSGLPVIMQEVGDATFWIDNDSIISVVDAYSGIVGAAENVGRKYLDPKVYKAIRSERYKSILRKIGQTILALPNFKRKEIITELNEEEKDVLDNFIAKLKSLGVISSDPEGGPGSYKFANAIYPVYIWMESESIKRERTTDY